MGGCELAGYARDRLAGFWRTNLVQNSTPQFNNRVVRVAPIHQQNADLLVFVFFV